MNAAEKISFKLRQLPVAQVIEIAKMAADREDEDGDLVLEKALMVLELHMDEQEFIALCDSFA